MQPPSDPRLLTLATMPAMNSVSEPPLTVRHPEKPVTFADVAMRIAHDGPMYAAIGLVGILAIKGQASASEMVITALASLLARSWPRAVQVAGKAGLGMVLPLFIGGAIAAKTLACSPASSASSTPATSSPSSILAETSR